MAMNLAICIRCGNAKRLPAAKCSRCAFQPLSEVDKSKSLILSTRYELDGRYLSKTEAELLAIGTHVQNGTFEFDEDELKRVTEYARHALALTPREYLEILKWLIPPVFVLSLAVWFWL